MEKFYSIPYCPNAADLQELNKSFLHRLKRIIWIYLNKETDTKNAE